MAIWRELPEFAGIDLEDSFVLGWREEPARRRVVFDLEASLLPSHAAYSPPKPSEYSCYRVGALVFEDVSAISGLPAVAAARPIKNASSSVDYGTVDGLSYDGGVFRFELDGAGGVVTIEAKSARIIVPRAPRQLNSNRDRGLGGELAAFVQQYGRKAYPNSDPNDRRYDRKLEQVVRRMDPEELDRLLHGDE